MTDNTAAEILNGLMKGRFEPGDCDSPPEKQPEWLNRNRFHKGRHVLLDNYYSTNLGIVLGHFWMAQYSAIMKTLIYTGVITTKQGICNRLRGTVFHIYYWHHGDVWNPNDEAHESIKTVRKMHTCIARRMNAEMSNTCPMSSVWISQYDMAMTQFTHLGPVVLFPDKLGFFCTGDDILSVIHFWAGIGYLLGIEDRFNLCLQCKTLQDYRALFIEIVEREVKPALTQPNLEYARLMQETSEVIKLETDVLGDHFSYVHLAYDLIGIPVSEPVTWTTAICRAGRAIAIRNTRTPFLGHAIDIYAQYGLWKLAQMHKRKFHSTRELWWDVAKQFIERALRAITLKA